MTVSAIMAGATGGPIPVMVANVRRFRAEEAIR